jgi:hypothetical protein
MELDPQVRMAFEFASDLAKQLITLATGILALTITFTKDLVKHVPEGGSGRSRRRGSPIWSRSCAASGR